MRRSLGLGLTVLCLGLAGCVSSSTTRLNLVSEAPEPPTARPSAKTGGLLLEFTPTKDNRIDPEALGTVAQRGFNGGQIIEWVDHGLRALDSDHYTVRSAAHDQVPAITIHPSLLKLYVDSVSISKTAVIVIRLDFDLPKNRTAIKCYRGQYAGINWNSSASEVTSALNLALTDCLKKIDLSLAMRDYLLGATDRSESPEISPADEEKPAKDRSEKLSAE